MTPKTRRARWPLVLLLPTLLALAALAASCGEQASADEPPKIEIGKTECSRCHMIISDERFAAGLVDAEGEAMVFDDMGELIAVVQEQGLNERRAWVHNYDTKEWIDATTAFFVVSMETITPMGTGVSAFATREAADTFAAMNMSQTMTWDTMLAEWMMEMQHP